MPHDAWAHGGAYEAYMGRWSRLVATEFVRWLRVLDGKRWLDVGCGTGALTATLLDEVAPASVIGVDPSEGFLAEARGRITDERATFLIGDARALPVPADDVDAVVSALAINFVPDPAGAVIEFNRVVVPGGTVAAYVWDYVHGIALIREFWRAAAELDPAAADLDEGRRFWLCQPEPLARLWSGAELRDVEVSAFDVPTVFVDFDDYWRPFLGGQGPAPRYTMSLSDERRDTLRELLRARLPAATDGSIRLFARAWAVRGLAA